jgi:ATP-dependent DNA ligase
MLARLERELPGGLLYEPKWDGFRCLAFKDGEDVVLRSRHDRPLERYFPELVAALATLPEPGVVLDGEILASREGEPDFTALLARLHPARSRVERLSVETPACFIGFDVLAVGGEDLRGRPFVERRARLEELLGAAEPPLFITPLTDDAERAAGWLEAGGTIDGVVAKDPEGAYREGERAMLKVKTERTADCVVAGFRLFEDRPLPSSLLLGLYDEAGRLRHVGIASSFAERERRELLDMLRSLAVPLAGHPWEHGFLVEGSPMGRMKGAAARWLPEMGLDWVPVEPRLVVEVAYDHVDGDRFRHPARFRRLRTDREPQSCTFEQLPTDARAALSLP